MMIEMNKKITPYLDGSLSNEERSQFEAYVRTNSDFAAKVQEKEKEIQLLRSLIPQVALSHESLESLESEIKQSVFNLLKEEPKNLWQNLNDRLEDWFSR